MYDNCSTIYLIHEIQKARHVQQGARVETHPSRVFYFERRLVTAWQARSAFNSAFPMSRLDSNKIQRTSRAKSREGLIAESAIICLDHAFFPASTLSMTMLIRLFVLLAAVAPYAFADVEFTSPSAGATLQGGSVIKVAWKDSGTSPPISSLQSYQLFLCAGGNDATSFVGAGQSRSTLPCILNYQLTGDG